MQSTAIAASSLIHAGKCLRAFADKMNERALEFKMTNTVFNDPAGVDNYSCAPDIMRLLLHAGKISKICELWEKAEHTVVISGKNARELKIDSKTKRGENCDILISSYDVRVGKGGALITPKIYNSAVIVKDPDEEGELACVVMGADEPNSGQNNKFAAVKSSFDAARIKRSNKTDIPYICAKSAIVCKADTGEVIFEKHPEYVTKPASMSKMMTAILTYEMIEDFEQKVEITPEIYELLPKNFYQGCLTVGDILSVYDLISLALLPSNNLATYALGVVIGEKFLRK